LHALFHLVLEFFPNSQVILFAVAYPASTLPLSSLKHNCKQYGIVMKIVIQRYNHIKKSKLLMKSPKV